MDIMLNISRCLTYIW